MKRIVATVSLIGALILGTSTYAKEPRTDPCLSAAEVRAAIDEAVWRALERLTSPTYQACKLRRNGRCVPTRTFLEPVSSS